MEEFLFYNSSVLSNHNILLMCLNSFFDIRVLYGHLRILPCKSINKLLKIIFIIINYLKYVSNPLLTIYEPFGT